MNPVKVVLNVDGNLISTSPSNSDWGWYKIEQERMTLNDEGVARMTKLSAIIQGWMEDIRGLKWTLGMSLPGKIVIRESLVPFNKRNPEKDLKIAGKSGVICKVEGKPIYRRYFYNQSNAAEDVLIAHDNKEEIQAAYAALEESAEDYDIRENDPFSI